MSKFASGERVKLSDDYDYVGRPPWGPNGGFPSRHGTVYYDHGTSWVVVQWDDLKEGWGDGFNCWGVDRSELVRMGTGHPTIASDLSLKPQAKSVLRHLRRHGYITPMQAQIVYGIMRLAACIYELRQVGYDVKTAIKTDEHGHRYSRYELTVN